jgi:RimJ/RimL family protein N-acetyltransferase
MALAHIALIGQHVRLEPLSHDHVAGLAAAGSGARDTFVLTHVPNGLGEAQRYVDEALAALNAGRALPYATLRAHDRRVVGSTRFGNLETWSWGAQPRPVRPGPDALEIGWTWLSPDAQRTPINTEAKLLMLTHAFEVLNVERVQLKTDARNLRSRAAIERIGAKLEGILRRQLPAADGGVRDTAMYSIIPSEWPGVKAALVAKLGA